MTDPFEKMISTHKARREAHAIRLDFKVLTVRTNQSVTVSHERVDELWDEANEAAAEVVRTMAFPEYMSVLREMDLWYRRERA